MSVVAALLSIALFLAFVPSGAQKIIFNPAMSKVADHLGFTKRGYQRIGILEVVAGIALLIGLAAKGTSLLALLNEVAAGGLFVLMMLAVWLHVRKGDSAKYFTPALGLGVAALLELALRVAS